MATAEQRQRIGATLGGKYQLREVLGSGGMGVVYEAVNALTGRRVAIKLVGSGGGGDKTRQRLLREAQAAAKIQHPHVVDVLDVGLDGEHGMFLVMELLKGESLEDLLARKQLLSAEETIEILAPIAQALDIAHAAGVVHRDLKPSNIFLHVDGLERSVPKLVDFGIARTEGVSLTMTGTIAGTAGYMAPEQMKDSKRADARADIWALGVVTYQCLAGRLPFAGNSAVEVMSSVLAGEMIPLRRVVPGVDLVLAAAVDRALSLQPERRPQRATELFHRRGGAVAAAPPSRPALADTIAPGKLAPFGERRASPHEVVVPRERSTTLGVAAVEGADRPPAAAPRPRLPGRVALAAAMIVALGAGAALWKRSGKTAAAARSVRAIETPGTVAEEADVVLALLPRREPPRPALIPVAAGVTNLGSTPDEAREAREQCTDEVGVAACPAASFDRETPTARAEVPAFRMATNEITNRELFDWLASANQTPLRLHRRGGATWIADAEGELAALAGDATPEAGLRADGNALSLVPERADHPAVWTSRRVAQRLCHDAGLRLPRAAEWEWAARGAKRRPFPWGEAMFHCQRAVAARQSGQACAKLPRGPASVLEPPLPDRTPEGVRDLAGNVAEWVADPTPPSWADAGRTCSEGDCFAIKGGDWASPSWLARAASLRAASGSFAAGWLGWRCAGEER